MLKLTSNDSRRLQTGNQASIRHQKSNPATPSTTVPLSRPPLLKYTPIGLLKCLSLEKKNPTGENHQLPCRRSGMFDRTPYI